MGEREPAPRRCRSVHRARPSSRFFVIAALERGPLAFMLSSVNARHRIEVSPSAIYRRNETTSVSIAALTSVARNRADVRMYACECRLASASGPSRHIAPPRELGRFRVEADSQWHARSALSVENDPPRTFCGREPVARTLRPSKSAKWRCLSLSYLGPASGRRRGAR